jgi:hypothetical protein
MAHSLRLAANEPSGTVSTPGTTITMSSDAKGHHPKINSPTPPRPPVEIHPGTSSTQPTPRQTSTCHNPDAALLSIPMILFPTTGRFTDYTWYPQRPGGVVRFSDPT